MRPRLRLRPSAAVLLALVVSACAWRHGPAPAGDDHLPVVLAVKGGVLAPAVARREAAAAIERALGRSVVVLEAEPTAADLEAAARELKATYPAAAQADLRARGCRPDRLVLPALAHTADAAYRLRLEAPALVSGGASVRGGGLWAALGLRRDVTLRTQVRGTIELRTFNPTVGVRRARLRGAAGERLADVVARGLAALPPPPGPQWAAEGRRLAAAGCPLLALAVYEQRLALRDDGAAVREAALAALAPRRTTPPARELAATTMQSFRTALQSGDVQGAAAILAQYENDPRRRPATLAHMRRTLATRGGTRPAPEPVSCTTLCEMHMVEMCNNDRELWHEHQQAWESTPCGKKRPDEFLQACYLHQWLSGTFQAACVAPCDEDPDGRAKLRHILQQSGCRIDPS